MTPTDRYIKALLRALNWALGTIAYLTVLVFVYHYLDLARPISGLLSLGMFVAFVILFRRLVQLGKEQGGYRP